MSNFRTRINRAKLAALRSLAHNGIDPVTGLALHEIKAYLMTDFPFYPVAKKVLQAINRLEQLPLGGPM